MPDARAAELEAMVREAWNAWNEGVRDPDAFGGGGLADDFTLDSALTGQTYRGPGGLVKWMKEIDENFGRWRSWIDEVRPAGADRLVVLGGVHLRGRGSGVEFDQPIAWILDFHGDLLSRMRIFANHSEATAAAAIR